MDIRSIKNRKRFDDHKEDIVKLLESGISINKICEKFQFHQRHINKFLKEASNSLSIFINTNEWDFLSQRDLDSLKKKYEVQIKELHDFKD